MVEDLIHCTCRTSGGGTIPVVYPLSPDHTTGEDISGISQGAASVQKPTVT